MLPGVESSGEIQIIRLVVRIKRQLAMCRNGPDRTILSGSCHRTAVSRRNELHRNVGSGERRVEQKRFDAAAKERPVVTELHGPSGPVVFRRCTERLENVVDRLGQFFADAGTLQIRNGRGQ